MSASFPSGPDCDHAHSGQRARHRRWLRQFTAQAFAPTQQGDGPGPVRAAPLPSARVVIVVGSCGVAQGPIEVLDWSASTAPPASTALPSRPPGAPGRGWGRAKEWPRPRPVPPPERLRHGVGHGAGAASITAGSPTRKGRQARRGPAGGPNHPSWGLDGRGNPSTARLDPPPRPAALGTQSTQRRGYAHSQFKHPEDLHEDSWVPNVHIVQRRLRLTMPVCRKSTASCMPASIAVDSPRLRAETSEKRFWFAPIFVIAK